MKKVSLWTAAIFIFAVLLSSGTSMGYSNQYPIEYKYQGDGPYHNNTDYQEVDIFINEETGRYSPDSDSDRVESYSIYYPRRMTDGATPIITWGNGTRSEQRDWDEESYGPLLQHLAEWGFVVIASHSGQVRGEEDLNFLPIEMLAGIDYLLHQNTVGGSIFYGKLETDDQPARIGTTGHSQGGAGAINAAVYPRLANPLPTDPRVTCALPIAPGRSDPELANIAAVGNCPIFLIAGYDDVVVSPWLAYNTCYVPSNTPTIFGVIDDMDHMALTEDFGNARGYITAWFMFQLMGDDYAAQAFEGDDCELCVNSNWNPPRVRTAKWPVRKKNF